MNVVAFSLVLFLLSATNDASKEFNPNNRYMIFELEDGTIRIEDLHRPVPREGIAVPESDITFYLYNQANKYTPLKIPLENFIGTIETIFDPSKTVYVATHGLSGAYNSASNQNTKNAILDKYDVNFFVLDYRVQASLFYTLAVSTVPEVGRLASTFIKKLVETYSSQLNYGAITLVGQSLGGQVVGAIGANLDGQIGRIVGTDPAWPLFHNVGPELRLDPSDAVYVQVIHSNGGLKGYKVSTGDADYYPNGPGMNQPGCGADWIGNCAHDRASFFYIESIKTGGFSSTQCDSYENYLDKKCDSNPKSYIGRHELDITATGDYYLQTAEQAPFSLG